MYMVFELVDMGELFYHLRYEGRFSENQSTFFAAQVCVACLVNRNEGKANIGYSMRLVHVCEKAYQTLQTDERRAHLKWETVSE